MNVYFIPKAALFALLLLVSSLLFSQAPPDVHQIAERVDDHYNHLKSLQANFTEIYLGAGISRTESGTLLLKRPGRMRWDYREPREKIFVSDGKTAWFYVPGEHQARKAPLKKLDDLRSPLAYMLGKTKLQKEFKGLSLAPDVRPIHTGDVVLRGIPRNMLDRVSEVIMEVGPNGAFQRIVAHELDGSTTEFLFSDQKENVQISDSRFRFTPPPGVETIDMDEIGQ